jgi:putative sterol carrier protein
LAPIAFHCVSRVVVDVPEPDQYSGGSVISTTAKIRRSRPDPVALFFENLVSKGHEPLLHHASGTLRIDLQTEEGVERWFVTMTRGDVTVSHRNTRADATMRMDRKLFEGMVRGVVNLGAALLRGVLQIDGDLGLVMAFDRLFPGPRRSLASFLERQDELAG